MDFKTPLLLIILFTLFTTAKVDAQVHPVSFKRMIEK